MKVGLMRIVPVLEGNEGCRNVHCRFVLRLTILLVFRFPPFLYSRVNVSRRFSVE